MSRTEVFVDAAFAFAITMLVISVDEIPSSYAELVVALKATPAFLASFALLMLFWLGHKTWSSRFGLEDDRLCVFLSLALVFVVMVYLYPLRVLMSTMFAWISGGWLPAGFALDDPRDLLGIFQIYGIGFFLLAGSLSALYWRALALASRLVLSPYERHVSLAEAVIWAILAVTGLASALWAAVLPPRVAIFAGFVYFTLFPSTFLAGALLQQRARMPGVTD